MNINIPNNNYKPNNKEIREEVVQGICDAFLSNTCWNIFHPCSEGGIYRRKTNCIVAHENSKGYYGFHHRALGSSIAVKFTRAEMRAAVKELKKHGYYIHKEYTYGTWLGYTCEKYPSVEGKTRVESINMSADFDR